MHISERVFGLWQCIQNLACIQVRFLRCRYCYVSPSTNLIKEVANQKAFILLGCIFKTTCVQSQPMLSQYDSISESVFIPRGVLFNFVISRANFRLLLFLQC